MVSSVGSMPGLRMADFAAMRQTMFQGADADGSGALSLEEFKAVGPRDGSASSGAPNVEDIFSKIDSDGDGSLTQSELDADAKAGFKNRMEQGGLLSGATLLQASQTENRAASFLSTADTDSDGAISLDEFKAAKPEDAPEDISSEDIFAQLDSDSDGSLTLSELESGMPQGGPGGAGGPPPGPPPGSAPGPSADASDETGTSTLLDYLSSDSDDSTSLFSALDSDSDGSLSADELSSGMASLKAQMMDYLIGQQSA